MLTLNWIASFLFRPTSPQRVGPRLACDPLTLGVLILGAMLFYGLSEANKADAAWYDPLVSSIDFQSPNAAMDMLYLPDSGTFAVGAGMNLAAWKSFTLRGQYVAPTEDTEAKAGIGLSFDVTKAINVNGGQWLLDKTGVTIGVSALTNLDGPVRVEPAISASVRVLEF